MVERSRDWMAQARRNLELAKRLQEIGAYEWSCFLTQQACELSVKALFQRLGIDAWGHSVTDLLEGLPEGFKPSRRLVDIGRELDKAYIPTRYPNAHQSGAPFQLYTKNEAERLIKHAERIIKFCEDKISQVSSRRDPPNPQR